MRNGLYRVAKAITDDNGVFEANRRVRGKIRYILKWERSPWSIRSGVFGQAETKGPRLKNEPWVHHIEEGGKPEYYGTIHRALHNYYYKDIDSLRRPPAAGWQLSPLTLVSKRQMKIAAMFKDDGGNFNRHYFNYIPNQPLPTIWISRFEAGTIPVFATVTHELAHSTNARAGIVKFLAAENQLRETYALTIEWHLTNKFYTDWAIHPDFRISLDGVPVTAANPFRHDNSHQNRDLPFQNTDGYTSLMIDLIDTENQFTIQGNDVLFPIDNVSGYTIKQIEDKVMDSRTFAQFRTNLDKYTNPTSQFLDELFANWP